MMEDKELIAKEIKDLEGRIGQKVIFKYPIEEGILEGKLIDRHVFRPESWAIGPGSIDVRYYNVIDRIKFPDFEAIRFGYYRRKNGASCFVRHYFVRTDGLQDCSAGWMGKTRMKL